MSNSSCVSQEALAQAALFEARWQRSVTSFTERQLLRQRNKLMQTMRVSVLKIRTMVRLRAAHSQFDMMRVWCAWAGAAAVRHQGKDQTQEHAVATQQLQAEGSLFQQRSAALLGAHRKRISLMQAMGRWQLINLQNKCQQLSETALHLRVQHSLRSPLKAHKPNMSPSVSQASQAYSRASPSPMCAFQIHTPNKVFQTELHEENYPLKPSAIFSADRSFHSVSHEQNSNMVMAKPPNI